MKNFPKKVDSKTRYLRIEIPENLDLVLEGLIRKVLREQPDMENIYSFAAEYFESLIRIREQAGIKHSSNQIFPSSSDEDALQMFKLANTFQKPVHEKFFSLKNSIENQKLEKPEQKITNSLPNAKEGSDKKSNNHKLKFPIKSIDLTMTNKKSKTNNESITKVIDSKKSHKVLRKNQDNETVVKNKEHVRKHDEEKTDKLQEESVLKSAEINEYEEAKGNNSVLNGIRETCQVIQENTANSFLDNAEKENLKEEEKVIRNKNNESEKYENEKKSSSFYENREGNISNLEKNSDGEEKKKDTIEELQSNEETSKANEENKQDKKEFLMENEEMKERNDKEAGTPNEETSIKNNNNEGKKEEVANSGKSLENKNSEEKKIEEEKDVEKNDELNKNKSTTLPEENKTENKSVEQTLMSKNAGEILNFELVPSSFSERVFSNEKEDKREKSEGKSVNVTDDVDCSVSENKLKVPDSIINEIKEDLPLKNNENISKEDDGFCLNDQNPSVKKTDNCESETQSAETEINKEESGLKKLEEKDQIMSWPEKEEEENVESEVTKEKVIDKNFDFLYVSNTEMVGRESETDVKLCLKAEEEEEERRKSNSLNLEDEINESIQNLGKNGEELTVVMKGGNEADNDIKNRVFDGEDINKTDDINDSCVNKKSFFKTLTDSVKELDDEKLRVSDPSKEEIFSTAVKEENSKKEADFEILNNFNESKENNSDETNVITKLENEIERKPSDEKKENKESDAENINKNNDQKEEKGVESHIQHDFSSNQKTEELGKIEKNDDGEELCTVVDTFVLKTLKPKEDEENKEWNNEKNNNEAKTLVGRKIKTIETHYYDLLKVPEIVKKEYRVHHTEEKLPQTHTNKNEKNSEFLEEEKVKNGMILEEEKPKDSQPNAENKFFLFDSALNSEEIPLGDSLRANEIFLKKEKHYSSMEKMIAKATSEENKEDKVVVTEIVEKRRIAEASAVPLEPRDEEELKNQNLQTSENAKEEKHDKCKSSTEESESNNYESNASISAGSKSLDIDAAIISVDVKTVAEKQEKKEGDRKEEKVSGEISESAIDNSALQSTPKELLRGDEIERDDMETKEGRETEKKKLSRSYSQTLMKSEGLKEKSDVRKRNSLAGIRQESRDEDIWGTIEKELQMAATKIQSKFRGYSTRKKLRREDAVQSSTEEPSGSVTLVEETEDGGCQSTGEFHDSIVLSVHPR